MPQQITENQYPDLIALINETYTDDVEAIAEARVEDDGSIVAIATDEDRIIAFKYTDEQVSVKILNPEVVEGSEDEQTNADSPGKSEPQQRGDAEKFAPSPVTLGDIPTHDFGDTDWADVRSIAEDNGWVYDDDLGQYVDSNGEPVTPDDILQATYDELDNLEADVSRLGDQLVSGEIDVSEWEDRMAEIIVITAALFFLFGIGGRNSITLEHEQHLTERTRVQFEFLRKFSEGILTGEMTPDGIKGRAKLYVQDGELHYSQAQEFAHPDTDWPFYSNKLGGCQHCPVCPSETEKGIVPRGSLIPIGQRDCLWRCCCQYQYHKTQNERLDSTTMLSRQWGWVGGL